VAWAQWTTDTLAAQIRGEVDGDPNAAGGTVPARMENIVREAGIRLWTAHTWNFRRDSGSIVTVKSTATAALPADFAQMDHRWLKDRANTAPVEFTDQPARWQEIANRQTAEGKPKCGLVRRDETATTDWKWYVQLTPTPDKVYTLPLWYLKRDPWTLASGALADSASPIWPPEFHEGWHLLALYLCRKEFGRGEDWRADKEEYENWLKRQIAVNDATVLAHPEYFTEGSWAQATVETMAARVRAEAGIRQDQEGGSTRAQMMEIVRGCGVALWNAMDWKFRRKEGTLAIVAGASTAALPTDFGELDHRWLRDVDNWVDMEFTDDPARYRARADTYQSTDTGEPEIGLVCRDEATTTYYKPYVVFCPTADQAYSYKFWYLKADPWTLYGSELADNASPIWPPSFFEGWHLWSLYAVCRAFPRDEKDYRWSAIRKDFQSWLQRQRSENDETMTRYTEPIRDGYGDLSALWTGGDLDERFGVCGYAEG